MDVYLRKFCALWILVLVISPLRSTTARIDFRYPDVIVDPLPDCPTVGVFPHPRNCTWYYRCYSHIKGFYHRAYFQCEPGTVFSDVLDQCIGGRIDQNGCQDRPISHCNDCSISVSQCASHEVCPYNGDQVTIELCPYAMNHCLPCGSKDNKCREGEYYAHKEKKCYPSPDDPSMVCCNDCFTSISRCTSYNVCPSNGEKVTMALCPHAVTQCLPCNSKTNICKPNEYYSQDEHKCYPSPDDPSMACCDNCSVVQRNCGSYDVCPLNGGKVKLELCSYAVSECLPCKSKADICKEGEFYSTHDQKCYPSPDDSSMACCDDCSIVTSQCSAYEICPSNGDKVQKTLCSQAVTACLPCGSKTSVCKEGEYYSAEEQKCYLSPDDPSLECPACDDCYISTRRCTFQDVCPFGGERVTKALCPYAMRECFPCESQESICKEGEFYAMQEEKCFPDPKSPEMSCSAPPRVSLSEVSGSLVSKEGLTFPVICSDSALTPQDQWIQDEFCTFVRDCSSGQPQIVQLCSNYYHCFSLSDGSWDVLRLSCPPNLRYNYQQNNCIKEPKTEDRC